MQSWNVTVTENNVLTMTDPNALKAFQTLGLSYEAEGVLKMKFLGKLTWCKRILRMGF